MVKQILHALQAGVSIFTPYVEIFAFFVTVFSVVRWAVKYKRRWPTRHLRKVWGFKNGDHVIVVCSELDNSADRQSAGVPREFIYHSKYGDLDAYFEVVITLLTLYPRIKLQALSSGETEQTRIDMGEHMVLIGGPDFNAITEQFLDKGTTRYTYLSPEGEASTAYPDEIVLYCAESDEEHCETTEEKDYGYFERIRNPDNSAKNIVLIGGCHTVGVTAAVKAFSVAPNEQGEIRTIVLENARKTAKRISRRSQFAVLVAAERRAQTISVPAVRKRNIKVRDVGWFKATISAIVRGLEYICRRW